jgi:hypothetical protein
MYVLGEFKIEVALMTPSIISKSAVPCFISHPLKFLPLKRYSQLD